MSGVRVALKSFRAFLVFSDGLELHDDDVS